MKRRRKYIDRVGERYGRLVVIRYVGNDSKRHALWECRCDCDGSLVTVVGYNLGVGKTKSCGCLRQDNALETGRKNTTHGKTGTRLFRIWGSIKTRCTNSNHERWQDYGGRGISVCERWSTSFENFEADMKQSYDAHVAIHGEWQTTIDRIDNNKGYSPDNCRWATRAEQNRNQRKHQYLKASNGGVSI